MSAWDDLKGSLFAAGRDVSQKAKEVSEIAKLKMDIRSKEDFVEKQYAILGKAYYEENKANAGEKDVEQFYMITEAIEEIHRMKQQILDIQGVSQCPNCGRKVPSDNCFCSACGAKLDEIIVEAKVVSEEPIVSGEAAVSEEPADEVVEPDDIWAEEVTEE